ncbi:hypothetical protein PR048_026438 [Dryococelus australis]|uniref:Uncharacterized protein n=1 Tax=Dryococelus australis TaxID=614101 RepID=A0ABQ9GLC1_9NEOP|nr:hypothetical protein PR048_026438 [Dryococelus australis]
MGLPVQKYLLSSPKQARSSVLQLLTHIHIPLPRKPISQIRCRMKKEFKPNRLCLTLLRPLPMPFRKHQFETFLPSPEEAVIKSRARIQSIACHSTSPQNVAVAKAKKDLKLSAKQSQPSCSN